MKGVTFLKPFEGTLAKVDIPAGGDKIILMEKQLPFGAKHVTNVQFQRSVFSLVEKAKEKGK